MGALVAVLAVLLVAALLALGWLAAAVRARPAPVLADAEAAELLALRVLDQHAHRLDERLGHLERLRHAETSALHQMVVDLRDVTMASRDETARLAGALRDHRVRGLWGEAQLRRVIEHAGMEPFCDFTEQRQVRSGDQAGRPDVVVRLPNGRAVVIDAKAPLSSFLEAANADDPDDVAIARRDHAHAVRSHVTSLARRDYAALVDGGVDLVVLFLPGDAFLNAALDADVSLLEDAWALGVVLATPSSLFALLRSVAAGWQERRLADEAAEVARLGRELHERIGVFVEHHARVGQQLGRAVEAYNRSVGSLEGRLLGTARRLGEHGAASRRDLPTAASLRLDATTRSVQAEATAHVRLEAAVGVDSTADLAPLGESGVHERQQLRPHA